MSACSSSTASTHPRSLAELFNDALECHFDRRPLHLSDSERHFENQLSQELREAGLHYALIRGRRLVYHFVAPA